MFVDEQNQVARGLTQEFVRVRKDTVDDRMGILLVLCTKVFRSRCIVFFASKRLVHRMRIVFGLMGLKVAELQGGLTQIQRTQALDQFKSGEVDFLLATDVASRGLDIDGVETVINTTMPSDYKTYVHRVGRTARAGRAGCAVTLVAETERKYLRVALKYATGSVKQRVVRGSAIERFKARVSDLGEQIETVFMEEKEAKQLIEATLDIERAQNRMQNDADEGSRPKRTWFQTSEQKSQTRELSKQKYRDDVGHRPKSSHASYSSGKADESSSGRKRSAEAPSEGASRKKRRVDLFKREAPQLRQQAGDAKHYKKMMRDKKTGKKSRPDSGAGASKAPSLKKQPRQGLFDVDLTAKHKPASAKSSTPPAKSGKPKQFSKGKSRPRK